MDEDCSPDRRQERDRVRVGRGARHDRRVPRSFDGCELVVAYLDSILSRECRTGNPNADKLSLFVDKKAIPYLSFAKPEQVGAVAVILFFACLLQGIPGNQDSHVSGLDSILQSKATGFPSAEYNLTVNPSSVIVVPGTFSTAVVDVRSLGSFNGTVELNPIPNYQLDKGLSASVNPYVLHVPPNGTASSTLNVSATPSTPLGSYTVTMLVEAYPYQNETVNISVAGFTMSSSSHGSEIVPGSSDTFTVSIASFLGFTGIIHFTVTSDSSGPEVSVEPTTLALESQGTNTTIVHVHVPGSLYSFQEGYWGVYLNATSGKLSELFNFYIITPPLKVDLSIPLALGASVLVAAAVALYTIKWRKAHKSSIGRNDTPSVSLGQERPRL